MRLYLIEMSNPEPDGRELEHVIVDTVRPMFLNAKLQSFIIDGRPAPPSAAVVMRGTKPDGKAFAYKLSDAPRVVEVVTASIAVSHGKSKATIEIEYLV